MLTIRRAQIEAFRGDAVRRFVDDLAADLRKGLPAHVEALGEEGTRDAIREGIDRAETYGIVTREGITGYVKLMFLFGREFDADARRPWAREVLTDPSLPDETERMRRLVQAAMEFARRRAAGESGA